MLEPQRKQRIYNSFSTYVRCDRQYCDLMEFYYTQKLGAFQTSASDTSCNFFISSNN